jgi:hypothetical protein
MPPHQRRDGAVSSAILYLAIVAIWAFVLIPRWLRRPHLLGGENDKHEDIAAGDADVTAAGPEDYDSGPEEHREPPRRERAARPSSRSKVIQARRRLLTTLLTLMIVAAACTYLKLTSWWVCIPPSVMLGMYLLLLREAALADAERARWRAAEGRRVQAARHHAEEEQEEHGAQIIDISARLGDQLYDQYADATIRAVGD